MFMGKVNLDVLSSSRTSVREKLGLFNAKLRNENRRYIHRLIYQLNEQDLLRHSIKNVSLILVTSLLDGGLKWVNFDIITVEKQGHLLCFGCVRRITFNVTCNVTALMVLCSRKVSTFRTLQLFFFILQTVGPRFYCRGQQNATTFYDQYCNDSK